MLGGCHLASHVLINLLLLHHHLLLVLVDCTLLLILLLVDEFGVEEHHPLVHYLKERGHETKVLAEFPDQMIHLGLLNLNDE